MTLSGRVVAGYRIRDGEWLEIGRMSPQEAQVQLRIRVHYAVLDSVIKKTASKLLVTYTFEKTEAYLWMDHPVYKGFYTVSL